MEKIKVLIPTDFSVQSEYAYLMVKNIERKLPIEIHFLHVLNVPDTVHMSDSGEIETCGDINPEFVLTQKQIAERKLNNLKLIYGSEIITHLSLGKLTKSILNYSEKNNFDLIVMGRKGAWGWKEKLAGSETQMVARLSKIPLLSLMCDRSDLALENILFVHDFNNPKREELGLLNKIKDAFGSKIHFLQVKSEINELDKDFVFKNMDDFAMLNNLSNYQKHLMKDKDIEEGVVHFNEMKDMDLICIGTHGKGGIFHKSATEKLINHLFKPIISYHIS